MPRVRSVETVSKNGQSELNYPVNFQGYRLDMRDLRIRADVSDERKAELCHLIVQDLGTTIGQCDVSFMKIGMMLSLIKSNELYKKYASHIKTWSDFIREINIGIDTTEADNYVRMFDKFGPDIIAKGRRIRISRLLKISALVENVSDEIREDWLNKAETLPHKAFIDELRQAKGETPTDACNHTRFEVWKRCVECRQWIRPDDA